MYVGIMVPDTFDVNFNLFVELRVFGVKCRLCLVRLSNWVYARGDNYGNQSYGNFKLG